MSYCQGNIEDCSAEEFDCRCGIIACSVHGHVDEADNYRCPNESAGDNEECREEFVCDATLVAEPPPIEGLPCHLRHRWGILPVRAQ